MFDKDVIRSDLGSLLGVNMFFMKLGLILLIVLKMFVAKVCNLLISTLVVLFFFNKKLEDIDKRVEEIN